MIWFWFRKRSIVGIWSRDRYLFLTCFLLWAFRFDCFCWKYFVDFFNSISGTVSTRTFQVQFQHTYFTYSFNNTFHVQFQHTYSKRSFNTHISSAVSTHTFQVQFQQHTFQVQFQHTYFKCSFNNTHFKYGFNKTFQHSFNTHTHTFEISNTFKTKPSPTPTQCRFPTTRTPKAKRLVCVTKRHSVILTKWKRRVLGGLICSKVYFFQHCFKKELTKNNFLSI